MRRALLAVSLLATAAAPAAAEDLVFTLTNDSSFVIDQFYTSPSDTNDWEENVLAGAVLNPGDMTEVTIGDGRTQCVYDMKFVSEDGAEHVVGGVDLCQMEGYTLHDQ